MSPDPRPVRVRVTAPRSVPGRPARLSAASEIDAGSDLGEVFLKSLLRTQLRLALTTMALLLPVIAAVPLLFLTSTVRSAHVFGVPVAWVLLGAAAYPLLLALAWFFVRRAERNERQFDEMLSPRRSTSDHPSGVDGAA